MAEYTAATLTPERTVIIVIDMEPEFCKPGGYRYSPKAEAIIPHIRNLLGRARKQGVPIIFCHSVRNQQESSVTVFNYDKILQEGTWHSDIVEELQPRPEDIHVYKRTHDVWWQTDLEEKLAQLTDDPLQTNAIVTGTAAAGCAYAAIMGFHVRNYWTFVPLDCVDDNEWAKGQFSLKEYYNVFPTRTDDISFGPVTQLLKGQGPVRLENPKIAHR